MVTAGRRQCDRASVSSSKSALGSGDTKRPELEGRRRQRLERSNHSAGQM